MKKKVMFKTYLCSLLLVLISLELLVGTSFAWFTDSVSNTGNKIQAGTLKIDLSKKQSDGTYASVKGDDNPIFNYDKWEPGYSNAAILKIENNGNLAFKYQLEIALANGEIESFMVGDEEKTLADVIDVYFVESATDIDFPQSFDIVKTLLTKVGTLGDVLEASAFGHGVLLPAESTTDDVPASYLDQTRVGSTYVAIVLHMQEEAGNEYQNKSIGASFDIRLSAVQFTFEEDGFESNQYDSSVEYPRIRQAITKKITSTVVEDQIIVTTGDIKKATIESEAVNAVFNEMKSTEATDSNEMVIKLDVNTINQEEKEFDEYSQTTINLDISLNATMVSTSISGTKSTTSKNIEEADGYTTIEYFIGKGLKNVVVKHNGVAMVKSNNVSDDAGKGIYSYNSSTGIVTIVTKTFSPFEVIYEKSKGEVSIKKTDGTGDETIMKLTEFRDSVKSGNDYEDYTVTLLKDIDLSEESDWEPIGYYWEYYSYDYNTWTSTTLDEIYAPFCGIFDGDGHTISNLKLTDPSFLGETSEGTENYEDFYLGLFGFTYGGEIKNLTLKDCSLTQSGYGPYGLLVAEAYDTKITNCHIKNGDASGLGMGGLICDYLYYGEMNGCTTDSTSSYISTSGSYTSGLVAYGYKATIKNCINNAYVEGVKCATGIVGNCNQTNVVNCVNNGKIHSTGASDNDSFVGGIAGTVSNGNVSYCINNGAVSTEGSNSPASGIVGQNCSGNISNVYCCINTGNIRGAYASSMASGLYGSTPVKNCYNSGTISGVKGTVGISQPVYSGACNSENCINAGSISTGTKYLSTGTNTNSYYYSGSTLKNASNEEINDIDSVVSSLNTGLETPFWGNDNGIIKPIVLIQNN